MYFFDTYALVESFVGNRAYKRFFNYTFIVTHLNIAEFYSYLLRNTSKDDATILLDKMEFNIVPLSLKLFKQAAEFKLDNNKKELSWADCIGYMAAKQLKLKFLTGDKEFKGMANVEFAR